MNFRFWILNCVLAQSSGVESKAADLMTFQVVLRKGDDGCFVANCPSLKSCWSQGKIREEAVRNIREAIVLYVEPAPTPLKYDETQEVVELSL